LIQFKILLDFEVLGIGNKKERLFKKGRVS